MYYTCIKEVFLHKCAIAFGLPFHSVDRVCFEEGGMPSSVVSKWGSRPALLGFRRPIRMINAAALLPMWILFNFADINCIVLIKTWFNGRMFVEVVALSSRVGQEDFVHFKAMCL